MIRFAGVDLLMEDHEGEAARFVERYLPLMDLRLFGAAPTAFPANKAYNRSYSHLLFGASVPNWPSPPELKLNTLYWPTGASRWAHGLFLASTSRKNSVLEAVSNSEASQLILADSRLSADGFEQNSFVSDGSATGLSTAMYLLPPRPLSSRMDAETLWLLPLVDVRYFWQYVDSGDFEPASWEVAFSALASALGLVEGSTFDVGSIPSDYQIPDFTETSLKYENAAMLLDVISWNVGMRFVREISKACRVETAQSSESSLSGNLGGSWQMLAGDDFSDQNPASLVPLTVRVVFPPDEDNEDFQVVEESASDHSSISGSNGYVKTISSPRRRDPGGEEEFTEEDASAANEATAFQIASDYYSWLTKRHDVTFVGIKYWVPTGFDDFMLFSMGHRLPDGRLVASTRIQCLPMNVGIDELLQPASGGGSSTLRLAKTLEDHNKGEMGNVQYYEGDLGEEEATDDGPVSCRNYFADLAIGVFCLVSNVEGVGPCIVNGDPCEQTPPEL